VNRVTGSVQCQWQQGGRSALHGVFFAEDACLVRYMSRPHASFALHR
jgi:hypothetical protein